MKKYFIVSAFVFFAPLVAYAQVATVASLTTNTPVVNSGQPANFSWTLSNSSGSGFIVTCQTGVVVGYSDGSGGVTCGSEYSQSNPGGGGASLVINNVSGTPKNVTFEVIPKDLSGNDFTQGQTQTTITVYPLSTPISAAQFDTTTATSGQTTTLSWTGSSALSGVNINISCNTSIIPSSVNYTTSAYIPCGQPVFPTDLSTSGSLPLIFTNLSTSPQTITVTLLPAFAVGTYDGIHSTTLTLTVNPKSTVGASVDSFTASSTTILSGANVPVSWSVSNAVGTNFTLSCDGSNITPTSSSTGATVLSCNRQYILFTDAGASGSLTLGFKNISGITEQVTLTLVPSPLLGTYDGTKSKSIILTVLPQGVSATPTVTTYTLPGAQGGTTGGGTTGSYGLFKKARLVFYRGVGYGSHGDDVSALQQFFAQDSSVYPEGLVTGYFGPATLRAIQRFQAKFGIVSSGSPTTTGYGSLGPKTRAYINALK